MCYWITRSGGSSGLGTHECSLSFLVGTAMEFSHITPAPFLLSRGTLSLLPSEKAILYIKGQGIILSCQRLWFLISEYSIITSSVAKRWLAARLDYSNLKCLSGKCRPWVFKSTHNQIVSLTITACLRHQEYKYRLDKFWEGRSIKVLLHNYLLKVRDQVQFLLLFKSPNWQFLKTGLRGRLILYAPVLYPPTTRSMLENVSMVLRLNPVFSLHAWFLCICWRVCWCSVFTGVLSQAHPYHSQPRDNYLPKWESQTVPLLSHPLACRYLLQSQEKFPLTSY